MLTGNNPLIALINKSPQIGEHDLQQVVQQLVQKTSVSAVLAALVSTCNHLAADETGLNQRHLLNAAETINLCNWKVGPV